MPGKRMVPGHDAFKGTAKLGDAPEQVNRDMFKPFRSHNGLLG